MAESYNICLDVGGTKVLGAIFNEKDEIIYRLKKRSKSEGEGSADVEKVIISVVEEMIQQSGINRKKLNAIASCAPGVIDQDKGIVLFTPNLPWRNYDIAGAMKKKFGVPFFVGNDVNLGVLGEYKFGAAKGYKNIVGFFPGTGMGGGLILNGKLFTGNQFMAAEYGHMILDPDGPLCGCGQSGCLEVFSSKRGMSDYIRQQVAIFGVNHVHQVSSVVDDQIRTGCDNGTDAVLILFGRSAVQGKHMHALGGQGGGHVVLRAEGIATGGPHFGPSCRQNLAQVGRLGLHVNAQGNAKALERLRPAEFCFDGSQQRHVPADPGNFDFSLRGERQVSHILHPFAI